VLSWSDCSQGFQCATAQVPRDYANPTGPAISLALIRLPASDPAHRIGSLFVNPGGPGGSGVDFVRFAAQLFPAEVLARFDLVGFDPRGVTRSTPVRCFASTAEQQAFFSKLPPFPVTPREELRFIAAFAEFDALCAARNPALLPHMSTANAARDLDLLRQAVGDSRLTYLGLSYGTYLGNTYAQLFPDRVRALIIDGVLEPVARATGADDQGDRIPFSTRLKSDEGAFKTFGAFIRLCAEAGVARCPFAAGADTADKFQRLASRLLEQPVSLPQPGGAVEVTYAVLISTVLGFLYQPAAWEILGQLLEELYQLSVGGSQSAATPRLAPAAPPPPPPYDNSEDAFAAISCADTDNPRNPFVWPPTAHAADRRAPYFGSPWTYVSQPCATWLARDRGRYTGPWNHATADPVLVIGNTFDPATRYEGAVAVSQELPRARLLTLAGYGHTSFGKSTCVEQAETRYVVSLQLPPRGTVCKPDQQPFGLPSPGQAQAQQAVSIAARPPLPGMPRFAPFA
jgi:pimeloyl-ACP methyl ester carboxylesterase